MREGKKVLIGKADLRRHFQEPFPVCLFVCLFVFVVVFSVKNDVFRKLNFKLPVLTT